MVILKTGCDFSEQVYGGPREGSFFADQMITPAVVNGKGRLPLG